MAARPRLLFLSQWFEPEPTFKALGFAKSLRERGYEVDVLTGVPNFPAGKIYSGYRLKLFQREIMDGIRVTRVPLYPSHDASGFRRALNYLSFFFFALIYLLLRRSRYDAIYVYHPPITAGLAPALAGLVRRTPFILDVQDLWPDAVAASGMAGGKVERMLAWLCRFVYRRAALILTQSRGMARTLAARGVPEAKLRTILNWAKEDMIAPSGGADLSAYGFAGRFTFVYGGAIGPHQALASVIEAARRAAIQCPRIRVILIGAGVERDAVARMAEATDGTVRMMPPIPQERIADVFAAADVLLVHLADHPLYAFTIPSKTQFYLAMGRPVLAGLTGEAAEIVRESGGGLVVPPEDPDAMAAAMVALASMTPEELGAMGAAGRAYYVRNLSYAHGLAETDKAIEAVLGRR